MSLAMPPEARPEHPLETADDYIDLLQRYRFYSSGPLGRWLINHVRRRDGKAPFPWFRPRPRPQA
jgi:hypothetical protein